jgi:hypothetical protein
LTDEVSLPEIRMAGTHMGSLINLLIFNVITTAVSSLEYVT